MKTLVKQGWGADNPAFRQIFTSLIIPAATKDQTDAFNELQRLSGSPECAVRYLETVADLDVRELLSQVKAPTLVLHVRDDPGVPSDLGRELAAGIPGARFVALPGKNHVPNGAGPRTAPLLRGTERLLEVTNLAAAVRAADAMAGAAGKRVPVEMSLAWLKLKCPDQALNRHPKVPRPRNIMTVQLRCRSLGGEVLARRDQFGALTIGVRHLDYAAEIIMRFVGIAGRGCCSAGAVEAAKPLRIVELRGFIGGKCIVGATAFEQHVS